MSPRPSAFTINASVTCWKSKASTRCLHQNGRPWTGRELRILRRDYGKPGHSLRTIAAKLGRTCQSVNSKALLLGLSWPLEFRVSTKGRTLKLSDHQQVEAVKRLAAGESCRAIARTFHVHPSTISRLASSRRAPKIPILEVKQTKKMSSDLVCATAVHDPGCVKTSSRLCVSAQFAEAIDEAVH